LGMFDPQERVPWSQIPYAVVGSDAHEALSLDASRASITLLKNENQTLPLSPAVKKIAVIGPLADDYQVLLGNYHGTPTRWTTPVEGLRAKGLEVSYATGSEIAPGFPALEVVPATALRHEGQPGLEGSYYTNPAWEGAPALTRQDETIDFIWVEEGPIPGAPGDSLSVRWTGELVAPETGTYRIGLRACNAGRLFWGDELKLEYDNIHHPLTRFFSVKLTAGQAYPVTIEMASHHTDPQARLLWAREDADLLSPALAAAEAAEVVVLCLGLSPDIEGEEMPVSLEGFDGGDRTDIKLPRPQRELLDAITALGKPTVLVAMGGSAIALPDQDVDASLMAWYPGPHGGTAIADVLMGDYNPAGRLPVTFYRQIEDLPDFKSYDMAGRTYRYFEGDVSYPFGHGLSYSSFSYGKVQVPATIPAGEGFTALVEVTNTSDRAGEEVVQLYLTDNEASDVKPLRSLVGFQRIKLEAGASQMVRFEVSPGQTALITEDGRTVYEPGTLTLHAGGGQPGHATTASAVVEVK
ncbi:MAG: glucan 1,4-alpha-glucosidase, partial [Bacteroidetes bacterium]